MRGFILRMLITALGLWAATEIVPGVEIRGVPSLFMAALLLGLVNAVVRPIVVFLTFPITLVTLGLFLLVINALMFGLVARLMKQFTLDGFQAALLGSLVVSVISWFASAFVGSKGRVEVIRDRRRALPSRRPPTVDV
jgi:putative membrane protein